MGVLPIWTKVARELVPHLASPISRIEGIISVLFIYSFAKHKLIGISEKEFRQYFRLMEGMCEFYLFYESNDNITPCYGNRLFKISQKENIIVSKFEKGTFANGLYQYYRGTCRRAKLISQDWEINNTVDEIINNHFYGAEHNVAIKILQKEILRIFKSDTKTSLTPNKLLSVNNNSINKLLYSLFNNEAIRTYIKEAFYSDSELQYYAQACYESGITYADNEDLNRLEKLKAYIIEDTKEWQSFSKLENQLNCEPFLNTITDSFNLIQAFKGDKVGNLINYLTLVKNEISRKAILFLKLENKFSSPRFDELFIIAKYAKDGDVTNFIYTLIEYQKNIMAGRDKDPMIDIEGKIITALTDYMVDDKESLLEKIKNNNQQRNSYFIGTTASIYEQLFVCGDA